MPVQEIHHRIFQQYVRGCVFCGFRLDRDERVAWGSGRRRGACQLEPCWNLSPCYIPLLESSYTTNLGGCHHLTSRDFASFSSSGGELYTTLQVPGRIGWLRAVYRQTRWMQIRVHNHSEVPYGIALHVYNSRGFNPAHPAGASPAGDATAHKSQLG